MIVSARVHIFKLAGLVIAAFRIGAVEDESFDFIGRVQRVPVLLEQALGISLQNSTDIRAVPGPVLVDHLAEDHYLTGAEDIARSPVEGAPIHMEAEIAL